MGRLQKVCSTPEQTVDISLLCLQKQEEEREKKKTQKNGKITKSLFYTWTNCGYFTSVFAETQPTTVCQVDTPLSCINAHFHLETDLY